MKIVSSSKMGEIDRRAQEDYFIPGIVLMENAGIKLYKTLFSKVWNSILPEKTVFAAGKGNNGGDAFVMARQHFLSGGNCTVIIPDSRFSEGLADTHHKICKSLGIEIINWEKEKNKAVLFLSKADWIIEGLSGTGLKGELKNSPAEIAEYINNSEGKTCAVDIPSGIGDMYEDGFTAVDADVTLTVGLPKFALYTPSGRRKCGEIITVPIGFPPQLINDSSIKDSILSFNDIRRFINPPSPYTFKNRKGHTVIFAGSPGMTGAAEMCASACLNSLSGLVTLKVSEDVFSSISGISPSLLTGTENYRSFYKSSLDKYTAAAIGPGWGKAAEKKNWLKEFLSVPSIPCVIDADALNLLSELLSEGFGIKNKSCIITPHIGEFSRLTGLSSKEIQDNPLKVLPGFAEKHNITVVLKSHVTWISSPDRKISVIDGSNPAMATAGSGDILTGIISALLSYGLPVEKAAPAGVLLHQYSGLLCYNENGFFKSEKIIEYIGKALKEVFTA